MASDGTEGSTSSFTSSVSADGRAIAFFSQASNLVPGDTNAYADVFVRDRDTGTTDRVSVASDGTEGNNTSNFPSISADGRHVVFYSLASNLVSGDTNGTWDVFAYDRKTGVTERVSVGSDGTEANAQSWFASVSADGRYVAFESDASNLVPGDTNVDRDVFVRDREDGVTQRVSVASQTGMEGDDWSRYPALSADGRYVAFHSLASNLVPGDTNIDYDIFVHDRVTGKPSGCRLPRMARK